MILNRLLELPPLVSATLFILGTILVALLSHRIARALLHDEGDSDRRELANSVIFRVSALHGLILALVFAQELVNTRDVSLAASREAELVADTFFDLKRYDAEATRPIRVELARYTGAVLAEEWDLLAAEDRLSDTAWDAWSAAYSGILDLRPADPRQEDLRRIMIEHIRAVSGLRRDREIAARTDVPALFMTAALMGVVLTAVGYFTFAPTTRNLVLLSIFAAYTGLIIFFVVAFSNPYRAPGQVHPVGYQRAYTGELRSLDDALP